MLRYKVHVTVLKKTEEINYREYDFPYDEKFVAHMREEIARLIHTVHLVHDEDVYVLNVGYVEDYNS